MASDTAATFFSYARDDSQFALRLARDLRSSGASVWLDQLDIAPGQHWDLSVEQAVRACTRMLVILSPASVESNNVMDEVSFALEEGKSVIPVLHRDCVIPFRLRRMQYVDMRTEYENGLERLLKTLGVEPAARRVQPSLFIGSSPGDMDAAYALAENLADSARPIVWNKSLNYASVPAAFWLDGMLDSLDEAEFGVLVFGSGVASGANREETMLQFGLLLGRLGRDRAFLIRPENQPDTDFSNIAGGLTTATFRWPEDPSRLRAALAPPCDEVRRALQRLASRPPAAPSPEQTDLGLALSLAVPEPQRKHLLNLAQGKTGAYEGRGSLRSELRQLVSIGLIEKLPGKHIGDMQSGAVYDLADFVKLTERGARWVDTIQRPQARAQTHSES